MTSPREQAIEAAAKAFHEKQEKELAHFYSVRPWDRVQDRERQVLFQMCRDIISEYESARARLDGAKMMPRDATDWQPIDTMTEAEKDGRPIMFGAVGHRSICVVWDNEKWRFPFSDRAVRTLYTHWRYPPAMHDATPKEMD